MSCQEREEELFSVQAIYNDDFNTFEALDETHFRFRSVPIVLSIVVPLAYPDPAHLPEITIESDGLGVSHLQMFQLRMRLEAIIQNKCHEPVLFDLTEETREFTEGLRDDVKLCLEEEEEDENEEWVDYSPNDDKRITDTATVQSHMGALTLTAIAKQLPPVTQLLHAEIVLRTDLRKRYMNMRRTIQQAATHGIRDRRAKDAAWDSFGQEEIVFHGTLRQHVGSIVRSGFVVPGEKTVTGETVGVRCGSTWGQGIYTSPDPGYSLSYTDYTPDGSVKGKRRLLLGQKLIVCAIVMGRRRDMSDPCRGVRSTENGFDSHVCPSKKEYVVFHSAQVLPLYVLHIGDANHKKSVATSFSNNSVQATVPELTAYARKHLPQGFGAASGHRFVVEAIAPVDDDEELWGEYQHDSEGVDNKGEFQDERLVYHWKNYQWRG
ncbi:hypothetical protein H0H81_001485 [Sphagnurus paluster]|uniref:RWD domain-containing protein n=1 Tax=Sphagnurus paluster TaxID=117069 RepID=A0A9P7GG03_9AGAR|nr:hypothetical protein H0H81_001485 [Sphagnurus paluster]